MKVFKKKYWDELMELEVAIFRTQEEDERAEQDAWEKEGN
jgi:hypothetical protein